MLRKREEGVLADMSERPGWLHGGDFRSVALRVRMEFPEGREAPTNCEAAEEEGSAKEMTVVSRRWRS